MVGLLICHFSPVELASSTAKEGVNNIQIVELKEMHQTTRGINTREASQFSGMV
jgi:hypothetical protein